MHWSGVLSRAGVTCVVGSSGDTSICASVDRREPSAHHASDDFSTDSLPRLRVASPLGPVFAARGDPPPPILPHRSGAGPRRPHAQSPKSRCRCRCLRSACARGWACSRNSGPYRCDSASGCRGRSTHLCTPVELPMHRHFPDDQPVFDGASLTVRFTARVDGGPVECGNCRRGGR